MFESKNSFIYILLSIRVPIEKKNKILFSHFILFFIYSFFGHAGLENTPSGPSRPQWAQWGAVGRSGAQYPPQWAAETAPAAMPIFGYNRPMPKWPVARPSIWVLAVVCFFGGVRLAV